MKAYEPSSQRLALSPISGLASPPKPQVKYPNQVTYDIGAYIFRKPEYIDLYILGGKLG